MILIKSAIDTIRSQNRSKMQIGKSAEGAKTATGSCFSLRNIVSNMGAKEKRGRATERE